MDQTRKLLQMVVENGRMGEYACDQLIARTDDTELRRELMLEKRHYADAAQDAEQRLNDLGARPQPKGPAARAGMWMGMQLNTMMDKSAAHIAEMVIQGATMGVLELTKARNSFPEADAQAQGFAAGLITRQQEAIDRLKPFLREKTVV